MLRPSSVFIVLTVALFVWFATLAGLGSYYSTVVGNERFFAWGLRDGAIFIRNKVASPASSRIKGLHPHSYEVTQVSRLVSPLHWRSRWGLAHETSQSPRGRIDAVYVSYPWLFGATVVPAAVWIMLQTRRPRRRVAGTCPNCEYDVRATPDRCPECGQVLTPPSPLDRLLSFDVKWLRQYARRNQRGFAVKPVDADALQGADAEGNATAMPPEPPAGAGGI